MLFAEHEGLSVQEYGIILAAILTPILTCIVTVATLLSKARNDRLAMELAAAQREQRTELKTEEKINSVKEVITETTRVQEAAATVREVKLDAVAADQKVLVKQTDGMQTALGKAIKDGSFDAGRLSELDKKGRLSELDKKEIEKQVVKDLNGHGSKLDEVATTTKEIKLDTGALVNEIAADVRDVKDRLPEK